MLNVPRLMLSSEGNWLILQAEVASLQDYCRLFAMFFESQPEKYLYSRDVAHKVNGNIGIWGHFVPPGQNKRGLSILKLQIVAFLLGKYYLK